MLAWNNSGLKNDDDDDDDDADFLSQVNKKELLKNKDIKESNSDDPGIWPRNTTLIVGD